MSNTVIGYREMKDCRLLVTTWNVGGREMCVFYEDTEGNCKTKHRFMFNGDGDLVGVFKDDPFAGAAFSIDDCVMEALVDKRPPKPEPKPRDPSSTGMAKFRRVFPKNGGGRFVVSEGSTGEWSKNLWNR